MNKNICFRTLLFRVLKCSLIYDNDVVNFCHNLIEKVKVTLLVVRAIVTYLLIIQIPDCYHHHVFLSPF